eukprot:g6257.t1
MMTGDDLPQYDSCNGTVADIGNGHCDAALNTPFCGWDGGDATGIATPKPMWLSVAGMEEILSCVGASFVENTADVKGGAVYLVDRSEVSCGGSWLNNTAGLFGGAVSALYDSSVYWQEEATFAYNTAQEAGGALDVDGYSSVSWNATTLFDSNKAESGGGLFVVDRSTAFWDGSTTYVNNSAAVDGGGLFVADDSSVSWNATTLFDSNKADWGGGLFVVDRSTAFWDGSTTYVNNSAAVDGGGLFVADDSSVSWNATTLFDSNKANWGGGLFVVDRSTAFWDGSTTYVNNSAAVDGGALAVYSGSRAVFAGKVLFEGNSATGANAFESGVGGALTVSKGSSVSWTGALEFSRNTAAKIAGALYVEGSDISWSSSTHFVANTARRTGGGLFFWNGSHVDWTGDTHFVSNEAEQADGGAVGSPVFDTDYNLQTSTLVINGSTDFVNNTSGANGGALALFGLSAYFVTTNIRFIENKAENAGGAVYMSGSGFGPALTGVRFISNHAKVGGAASFAASGDLKGFADIEWPNPTTVNRCLFVDNRASETGGAIESAAGRDLIVNSVFQGNQAGGGGALRLAGTATLDNCTFVDNISEDGEGAAVSNIGSISKLTNSSFSGNAFSCQPGMFLNYSEGHPYEAICSGCQTTCEECFFRESLVPACVDVMTHSISPGGTVTLEALSIEPGYWRATVSTKDIAACYHAEACLGGVTESAGYCLEGYEGPYCSVCSDGYSAQLGFTCSKCSNSGGGIAAIAAFSVMTVVVGAAAILYVTSVEVGCRRRRGSIGRLFRNIPLQSVKIVIVVWQILTQFAAVANVTYPGVYQRCLNAVDSAVNFDWTWMLSAGCVFDVDFHDRLLAFTIAPLVALLFLAGTYAAATNINRGARETMQIVRNKHVALVLLLTFLIYSSVSAVLFEAFSCESLDNKSFLRADYRIECDSPKHKAFQAYAVVMVLLYTVGIPAFYGYLLFRDRAVLTLAEADRGDIPGITTTSDLWKPYRPSVFYNEVIECIRRVLLTGAAVFFEPNTSAQVAVTLMVAFAFVLVSEGLSPYASRWDAWLNRMGHCVVFVSMYVALLLKVDVSDERAGSQEVFEAILVGAHACMILVVLAETVVLACSLKAEQRRRSTAPRLQDDRGSGGKSEVPFEEDKILDCDVHGLKALPAGELL